MRKLATNSLSYLTIAVTVLSLPNTALAANPKVDVWRIVVKNDYYQPVLVKLKLGRQGPTRGRVLSSGETWSLRYRTNNVLASTAIVSGGQTISYATKQFQRGPKENSLKLVYRVPRSRGDQIFILPRLRRVRKL